MEITVGIAKVLTKDKTTLDKRLVELLIDSPITAFDAMKLYKIKDYHEKFGTITEKQSKAILHFSRVYDVKDLNSIKFMMDD